MSSATWVICAICQDDLRSLLREWQVCVLSRLKSARLGELGSEYFIVGYLGGRQKGRGLLSLIKKGMVWF